MNPWNVWSITTARRGLLITVLLLLAPLARADYGAPERVVLQYVEACYTGNAKLLESLFHPDALMTGQSPRGFYLGSPEPFFKHIRDSESLEASGAPYVGRVTSVQVSGPIATVTLEEEGYFGRSYTDIFTLIELDGAWKIVTKTYYQSK